VVWSTDSDAFATEQSELAPFSSGKWVTVSDDTSRIIVAVWSTNSRFSSAILVSNSDSCSPLTYTPANSLYFWHIFFPSSEGNLTPCGVAIISFPASLRFSQVCFLFGSNYSTTELIDRVLFPQHITHGKSHVKLRKPIFSTEKISSRKKVLCFIFKTLFQIIIFLQVYVFH